MEIEKSLVYMIFTERLCNHQISTYNSFSSTVPSGSIAQSTGSATNPYEECKISKMTLQFCARNAKFSESEQL